MLSLAKLGIALIENWVYEFTPTESDEPNVTSITPTESDEPNVTSIQYFKKNFESYLRGDIFPLEEIS